MVLGFACVFLLIVAALLLRFGIPRSDLATLPNLKWFAAGLAVMFALLSLFALAGMGSAAALRDSRRVSARADVAQLPDGTPVIFDARISSAMPVDKNGWVASKTMGSTTGETPPLVVELSDGRLALSGESYADFDWQLDDAETHIFLERDQPVTVLGKVVLKPTPNVGVERVIGGNRADGIQNKARVDFLLNASIGLTSLAASPGILVLLLLAGRRRRRELLA